MARQTTPEERSEYYRRNVRGETYEQIAAECNVSMECVRYWCRKQKRGQGVHSHWHIPTRGELSQFDDRVRQRIVELRDTHPRWGPVSIRIQLALEEAFADQVLPAPASIGRFLHSFPRYRRQTKPKRARAIGVPLTQTHQRWQIDFKSYIRLGNGQTVQLHDVSDPFSGAHLAARVYRAASPNSRRVPLEDVRATLRVSFSEWATLPDEIQTDGEPILAGKAGEDYPTLFRLWLVGLGVTYRVITPGKPTQNGSVERDHRTTHDYTLVGPTYADLDQLQHQLDADRRLLNEVYPSRAKGCAGQPPLQAHPELRTPRHAYHPELEREWFDLRRVDAFLATQHWERRVSKTGQITLGGQHAYYTLSRQYAGQIVQITFDPVDRTFVASLSDEFGHPYELKRWPARGLSAEDILGPLPLPPAPIQLPLLFDFVRQQVSGESVVSF
jgi:transposase InsO family protein